MPIMFLLVSINPAVRKIFNITAKKADIRLDVVNSISQIPLNESYNCIFVDDGVLDTGNIEQVKSKFVNTKLCLILSKDASPSSTFDTFIRKPFLPIDIYEVLKKEKTNNVHRTQPIQSNQNQNNVPKNTKEVAAANNDVDLLEFSDSGDEFLSGERDSNDFTNLDSKGNSRNIDTANKAAFSNDANNNFINRIGKVETIKISSDKEEVINEADYIEDAAAQAADLSVLSNNDSSDVISGSDDIDFSSIFKLQNELLQEEEKNKKTGLIGGDGYKKKEPKPHQEPQAPKVESSANLNENIDQNSTSAVIEQDSSQQLDEAIEQTNEKVEQDIAVTDEIVDDEKFDLDWFDNNNLDEIKDVQSFEPKSFPADDVMQIDNEEKIDNEEANIQEEQDNTLDLPIDDNDIKDVKDINELSEDELEKLDDEALLLLQEQSLDDYNEDSTKDLQEPKVLDKQDINELTDILNATNDVSSNVSTQNEDFGYLSQDVNLLDDESVGNDNTADEVKYEFDDMQEDTIEEPLEQPEQPIFNQPQVQEPLQETLSQEQQNAQINPSNVNLDLTDIIKSFPVDKLRELLSGVQITINITFPTKK